MTEVAVPAPPPLVRIPRIELIHTGQWPISTGVWTATATDLQAAVAALDCPAVRRPGLKIGHVDNRFTNPTQDGEPLLGYVDNLAVTDDGRTLVGDLAGLPAWLGATDTNGDSVLASAWPDRSIEGVHDFTCQIGHTHPFVLTAVALLGVTAPGVGTLQSLQDVATLYGVTATAEATTGVPIRAALAADGRKPMPNPAPATVAAGVTTEDVRRAYYDDAAWDMWITEFHLEPLQLVVADDRSGKHYRVPVTVTGEDTFTFGEPVEVMVRYVDVTAEQAVAAAAPVAVPAQRLVFASRAESRPGTAPMATQPDLRPPAEPAPPSGPPTDMPTTPPEPGGVPVSPAEPETTTDPMEDDVSDLSDIARGLGLPDDAGKDAILAAIGERKPADPQPDSTPEPTVPSPTVPEPAPQPTEPAEPVTVAASTESVEALKELRRLSSELAAIKEEHRVSAKAALFDGAVKAGKITPADRSAWETRYDKAPDVIGEILASIAPGTAVPVTSDGHTGTGEEGSIDDEYAAIVARLDGPLAQNKGA